MSPSEYVFKRYDFDKTDKESYEKHSMLALGNQYLEISSVGFQPRLAHLNFTVPCTVPARLYMRFCWSPFDVT